MRSKIVYDTKNVLNELGKRSKITLAWTKAHIGTKDNEIADSLTKEGGQQGKPFEIGLPMREIKNKIDEYYASLWEGEWQLYKGCLLYTSPSPRD